MKIITASAHAKSPYPLLQGFKSHFFYYFSGEDSFVIFSVSLSVLSPIFGCPLVAEAQFSMEIYRQLLLDPESLWNRHHIFLRVPTHLLVFSSNSKESKHLHFLALGFKNGKTHSCGLDCSLAFVFRTLSDGKNDQNPSRHWVKRDSLHTHTEV